MVLQSVNSSDLFYRVWNLWKKIQTHLLPPGLCFSSLSVCRSNYIYDTHIHTRGKCEYDGHVGHQACFQFW